jgi:phosphoketolase
MKNPAAVWAKGYGVVRHQPETRKRIKALERRFAKTGDGVPFWEILAAADRLASASMWLTVHDTYAKSVYLDGRPLAAGDLKKKPEGHTGSALNIIPAYVGYLAANALSGHTRGWLAEQGHAVSGIDCVNVMVGNVTRAHERYAATDEGLTRFVNDFYNYRIGADGHAESPRGSHVNPNTAGGILEGGYLGFAGLQYVHMPLKGERLVAFLSDGAFEEQRGPDWAARWWRPEDSGLVCPIMIYNGRRIDQRTTTAQTGGTDWFLRHLEHHDFEPVEFDGRDPAAYLWAILEMEERLTRNSTKKVIKLPYGIAVTVKGYGFYGAGTNAAHNLPLGGEPDDLLLRRFNEHARKLWVAPGELREAVGRLTQHKDRPREKDHAFVQRDVKLKRVADPDFLKPGDTASAMAAVDEMFVETCLGNPHLRPRVGNPDEMRSNLLNRTLDTLKHRVVDPEPGVAEARDGKVITALNEEAVCCAALANKGGLNLVHTYEAFGTKMYGAIRQEIIFAQHSLRAGRRQGWLSVPVILTSHTYENGKNEQSHQDPGLCEALLGEPAHLSRVLFPADHNSAAAAMEALYQTQGQIWTLVVAKRDLPVVFDGEAARRLVREGALVVRPAAKPQLILTAIGSYQLQESLKASDRLTGRGVAHALVYMIEPRRFAEARDAEEAGAYVTPDFRRNLFPDAVRPRLFVTHTRSGRIQGLLQAVDTGAQTVALGYRNRGGTYDVNGMMYINHQSWAHIAAAAARLMGMPADRLLDRGEIEAVEGRASPHGVIF